MALTAQRRLINSLYENLDGPYKNEFANPSATTPIQTINPRSVVSPPTGSLLPGNPTPIATSSQKPKTTNVQIPYARQAVVEQTDRVYGSSAKEGDVVFLERGTYSNAHPAARLGQGVNSAVRVRTIEALNRELATPRGAQYTYDQFPYRADGVVNNVDGGVDEHNYDTNRYEDKFKSHIIANVAVQGHVRLAHPANRWPNDQERQAMRCDLLKTLPGSIVYVGLECARVADKDGVPQYTHRLIRFSSSMITASARNGGIDLQDDPLAADGERKLLFAWRLGMIVDSNQSKNMLTICVGVDVVGPRDVTERDVVAQSDAAGNPAYVLRWTVDGNGVETAATSIPMTDASTAEQLNQRWKL